MKGKEKNNEIKKNNEGKNNEREKKKKKKLMIPSHYSYYIFPINILKVFDS